MANSTNYTKARGSIVVPDGQLDGGAVMMEWVIDTNSTTGIPWADLSSRPGCTFLIWTTNGATFTVSLKASPDGVQDAGVLTGVNDLTDSAHDPVAFNGRLGLVRPVPSALSGGGILVVRAILG